MQSVRHRAVGGYDVGDGVRQGDLEPVDVSAVQEDIALIDEIQKSADDQGHPD